MLQSSPQTSRIQSSLEKSSCFHRSVSLLDNILGNDMYFIVFDSGKNCSSFEKVIFKKIASWTVIKLKDMEIIIFFIDLGRMIKSSCVSSILALLLLI